MNKQEAIQRAIEFKNHSEEFESVSFIDSYTEFFEYVIKKLTNQREFVPEDSNGTCKGGEKCTNPEVNIFNDISTKAIVEELSKREGVKVDIADPHKDIIIQANGPAIILTVID